MNKKTTAINYSFTLFAMALAGASLMSPAADAQERATFIAVGPRTDAPIGYAQFCADRPWECNVRPSEPRDVVLTQRAWRDLERVNRYVNEKIHPMTDQDLFGVAERWTYPDTGKGDCEDYVLLKRKMLIDAGWPREALLITVVRDRRGDGHAVLTVKTDRGEYVLDNQEEAILPWEQTGYRFIKRQSQASPNVWVSLGDTRPAAATAAAR